MVCLKSECSNNQLFRFQTLFRFSDVLSVRSNLVPNVDCILVFLQEAFKAAGVETMDECFNFAVKLHSHKRMVGTRKVNSEEDEMQPNGKMFQKWDMGDYSWKSYAEVRLTPTYNVKQI